MSRRGFKGGGLGKGKFKKGDHVIVEDSQIAKVLDMEVPHDREWKFYKLVTPCGEIMYSHEGEMERFEP